MSRETHKKLVRDYFDAIAAADFERIAAMMRPDLLFRCAGGTGQSPAGTGEPAVGVSAPVTGLMEKDSTSPGCEKPGGTCVA